MAEEAKIEQKYSFPSETVDLPSGGSFYPEGSPLKSGKIDLKYMTAKEEDMLTSQNLIKKGVVIDKVLNSLVLTENVNINDLILGDKNAVMIAARILAYGPEYPCEITNPNTGEKFTHAFNLTECEFKKVNNKNSTNSFDFELPASKTKITFKILTGNDEKAIEEELKNINKAMGAQISPDLTTRLRYTVTSVGGDDSKQTINAFVDNMLSRDSYALRKEILRVSPDIDMTQEIDIEGDLVKVAIPMTVNFFWPDLNR